MQSATWIGTGCLIDLLEGNKMKNRFQKTLLSAGISMCIPALATANSDNRHEDLEEVIVTSPFSKTALQSSSPVTLLSGEKLLEKVANSLGETLKDEVGISSSSFGPSVGHPVIRGQSGNRVSVLQNGVGVTDVSNQSPDHAEAAEAILANRIEVLRGPATLLYGSGAVGGVVNVIDGSIPEQLFEKPSVAFEQSHNTNNEENKTVLRLDASSGNFSFHFDGFRRDSDNVEIDGFAIDEEAIEAREELLHAHEEEHDHEDEHEHEDEHDEEEHEELENSNGFIDNSDSESEGYSLGFSYVTDNGFIGFAVSHLDNDYGLPGGSHTHEHGHEDEEHHEDEEEGAEEEHEEEGHEEEIEAVRIDMEKTRYDIRGQLNFNDSPIESIRGAISFTDYEHDEIEFFEDGENEVGTRYKNEGIEGRFTLNRAATGPWSGVYGLQFGDTEFSAVGEEAFIPKSDTTSLGVFAVEQYSGKQFTAELGLRFDNNEVESGQCSNDESAFSVSGRVIYDLNDNGQSEDISNVLIGLSRSERTPSVEELFSNIDTSTGACGEAEEPVLHAATNLLEIGNPNLDNEVSNNLELGYRYRAGQLEGEVNVYYNQISDYIFLALTGEEEDELLIAEHRSEDATFTGIEAKLTLDLLASENLSVKWSLFGDSVNAEFDDAGDVPRIPAAKIGSELRAFGESWTAHIRATQVSDQNDVGEFELETEGYTMVNIYADYHWPMGNDTDLTVFVKGNNLLDEEVRNHASFVKDFAPDAGLGFVLGLRVVY